MLSNIANHAVWRCLPDRFHGGKMIIDPNARREQLHAIARAYVTEGLGKKNFDAIPYNDNVTLRARLCPGGMDTPLSGRENLR